MIYINIFLIAVIVSFGLDVAHFWDEISSIVSGWITKGVVKKPIELKPFSCSLCSTFWISLIYVICINAFSLPMLAYICVCAWATCFIPNIFLFVEGFIVKIINELAEYFQL